VVGGILPLGTGAAYAAKSRASGQIAVCLFGDGALEEGAVPEAFNLASLWKLPVLYLCENNGKYGAGNAVGAMQSSTMAVYPLTDLPAAYKIPAVRVDGTDAAAVHDATAFCAIYQAEMMGFAEFGRGGELVESGETAIGGRIPINTSGGLVSKGHPVGATGRSMIYELARQLRGEAGARQVEGAQLALSENGGGVIGFDEAACAVTILERAG